MVQQKILKIIAKEKCLFGAQIIEKLRVNGEPKLFVSKQLKSMRKFEEINFILIVFSSEQKAKKIAVNRRLKGKVLTEQEALKKIPHFKDAHARGYRIRRETFFYYL